MFESKDILIGQLRSPMNIASMALSEIESRLGGGYVIADVNSPFCHLLEFSSSINSATINTMDNKLNVIYPARAKTMDDLFHHMSDFDYLRMYSTPSQTVMRMTLPKHHLIENALDFNTNYKQVTIPKDTVFTVGTYIFGIHHPINILINNFTKTFTAVYDTTYENPLMTLTTNVVNKFDTTINGIDYLILDFPIYQFAKSSIEETLVSETGFSKKIVYNNKFHALRIYNYKNNTYTEMGQSQSAMVYDTAVPTALIRVLPDEQKIQITIPQIYFDNGVMGSKVLIEVYTTLGELDIDTTNIPIETIQANFAIKSKDTTAFSTIFRGLPFDLIMQLNSPKITGGSNAIEVSTLRDRVVNDTLYEKAPISEAEMAVYLEDNSFYLKKYRDNVTDRIYSAYRVLEDGKGAIIPSITLRMRMQASFFEDRSTFKLQSDESITILPSSIFKYIEGSDDVLPLTDTELTAIAGMNKEELANELNNNQHFKTPYHMKVILDDFYPQTISYDLMTPVVEKTIFEAENLDISAKMMSFAAKVEHLDQGVGGFRLDLSVFKSDDLKDVPEDMIKVYVVTRSAGSYWIGREAVYSGSIEARDIYSIYIDTNYHLSVDNEIGITNFQNEDIVLPEHMVDMTNDYHVVFMVEKIAVVGSYQEAPYQVTQGVPSSILSDFVALSRQYVTLNLGHKLDDIINNNMEASATPSTYVTWEYDVPAVYETDTYVRDENGMYVVDAEGKLTIEHERGEQQYDNLGQPIFLHRIGDVRRDVTGEPMVEVDRDKIYYIDTMFIDAKVFASERQAELDFTSNVYNALEGYFTTLRNLQNQLLERTDLYFKCVRSTGMALFNMGDGVTSTQNIEMSFSIVCYVPSYVKYDEDIQNVIREKTCTAIEEAIKSKTISMLDIFESVKEKMADYIDHFTLLGINGSPSNQTFTVLSEDAQPSVARKLELSEDNVLSLNKQIHMEFVAFEDHILS